MPTKTERIVANLPGTFKALPRPSTLYSVINAFGGELLNGENNLAAVMLAHWVDHADLGAERIDDLARIAALYGLAPRPDESVEEFRTHLKRYIRTFIEGTVTVQGIMRLTAETLALEIADQYEDMDTWWTRRGNMLTTHTPRGDDAALRILGVAEVQAVGHEAQAARIEGTVDLSAGIDLSAVGELHLAIDGAGPATIDLLSGAADSTAMTLDELVAAINAALGSSVAGHDGRYLRLVSPTSGLASHLQILDGPADAAEPVFGLQPRRYEGRDAVAARVTGSVDLSGGIDLSSDRFLRLFIDGAHLAEIDCAGATPANSTLDEVRDAINAAFGFALASHDGILLFLTAPSTGLGSRIEFKPPAAQDATLRLFGQVPPLTLGSDAVAAKLVGTPDLAAGIDLSDGANLSLSIDEGAVVSVNCAGADPHRTQLPEIVSAINTALGTTTASHNGRRLILASPTVGAAGRLDIAQADEGDASETLLGLKPRDLHGAAYTQAQVIGGPDLASGIDLAAVYRLNLALDGNAPVSIDLRHGAADVRNVTLAELTAAINHALGAAIATHDGQHLLLASPTSGSESQLAVIPLERRRTRRFVSRTPVLDEAAPVVFGMVAAEAVAAPATAARLIGTIDLSRGVDLRAGSNLRLALDGAPPVEIDCAGPRPRATALAEILSAVNTAMAAEIASTDGRHLILTSPLKGETSRIGVETSHARDAIDHLLGVEPGITDGAAATGVVFTGTADLMEGIALPANAAVKIGIDGAAPLEIVLTGADAENKSLNQLMLAINIAFGETIARHDGIYLSLVSPVSGAVSSIEFATPAATDVTRTVFGIIAPRHYHGEAARAAVLTGTRSLSAGVDMRTRRYLRLGIDAAVPREIDCAAGAADPAAATLDNIVAAINAGAGVTVADHNGDNLILTSPQSDSGSRLVLEPYQGGDAALALLGFENTQVVGTAAREAVITGTVDIVSGIDLSRRRHLRLAVDGGRPVDIDVAGAVPSHTFGGEIVAAINRVFPNLARLTDDDRLALTTPNRSASGRLDLLPLRYIEVIEYPAAPQDLSVGRHHGESLAVDNAGASEVFAEVWFHAAKGGSGPGLADVAADWRVTLGLHLGPGEKVHVWRDATGTLRAALIGIDGRRSPVAADKLWITGNTAHVLQVPQGHSQWVYLNCLSSRFNAAHFDRSRFAGGLCLDRGVFNISRFGPTAEPVASVFAWPHGADPEPAATVTLQWQVHLPGAFQVNLPADLPPRFGSRFNHDRFALPGEKPEFYPFSVTEPVGDPDYLPGRLNAESSLVRAEVVVTVPLGWQPVAMPFRKPRYLTLGSANQAARIYLVEEGIQGFLQIEAKISGAAGNSIQVAARNSGPALFDVTVNFVGGRFENARQIVKGEPLPSLTEKLLQPGPVGVLQGKAAGVLADVTRERTADWD